MNFKHLSEKKLKTSLLGNIFISLPIMKNCGIRAAFIMGELISLHLKLLESNGFVENEWIPCSVDHMKSELGIGKYSQKTSIINLIEHDLIEIRLIGFPRQRHFKINAEKLIALSHAWEENEKVFERKIDPGGLRRGLTTYFE